MVTGRTRYQGTLNIIRFNWHYYVIAFTTIFFLAFGYYITSGTVDWLMLAPALIVLISTVTSLAVSLWVYDLSDFYKLEWMDHLPLAPNATIFNIHAGFDETSALLAGKYPGASVSAFDFYDPVKHTEISIKRARKSYPAYPGTRKIASSGFNLPDCKADLLLLIFALHEIRNTKERRLFLHAVGGLIKNDGQIVVVEHQRDLANFLAFNIGFFHFYSRASWVNDFRSAGYIIDKVDAFTPFVHIYTLKKNDNAS